MTAQELTEIKEFCIKSDKSLATVNFDGDMWKVTAYCVDEKTANMLATIEDYIPALLTEIERLHKEVLGKEAINRAYGSTVDLMRAEIERLKDTNKALENSLYNSEMNLSHLSAELERLEEAIKVKGGTAHYPTEDAYLTVCKALEKYKADRKDLRNELCLKCGKYRESHNGACDGCRWESKNG